MDEIGYVPARRELGTTRGQSLVDVLDRILDKGLVIAGDIRVNLAEVELLTIRIRLLVCSIDKAAEIGLDWWRTDAFLSTHAKSDSSPRKLEAVVEERLEAIDARLAELERRESES